MDKISTNYTPAKGKNRKNPLRPSAVDAFLKKRSSGQIVAGSLFLVTALAVIDHTTGYELSFSVFYLVPIAVATWYGDLKLGIFLSTVSSIAWLMVDSSAGHSYSHALIPLWNTAVRLAFFTITALLLGKVRSQLKKEQQLARIDGLSGIMNRHTFEKEVQSILSIATRYGRPTVMGYIDLDNFKSVNDNLGHAEGDNVIRTVASVLSDSIRTTDLVGRLGGDEFAIFLPETATTGAVTLFENLRKKLLKTVQEHHWPIGFSIGVALFRTAPSTVNEAVKIADALMYRVKNGGKNTLLFEEFDLQQKTSEKQGAERLRRVHGDAR